MNITIRLMDGAKREFNKCKDYEWRFESFFVRMSDHVYIYPLRAIKEIVITK